MSDRELLELAAKAAEIEYGWQHIFDDYEGSTSEKWCWNPLTHDGDALRLAIQLGMNVAISNTGQTTANTEVIVVVNDQWVSIVEYHGNCREAATKRAIVRAAAEIGRAMK